MVSYTGYLQKIRHSDEVCYGRSLDCRVKYLQPNPPTQLLKYYANATMAEKRHLYFFVKKSILKQSSESKIFG